MFGYFPRFWLVMRVLARNTTNPLFQALAPFRRVSGILTPVGNQPIVSLQDFIYFTRSPIKTGCSFLFHHQSLAGGFLARTAFA